ncbi:MAG TPA: TIGR03617 family F420-dependent LLM class oxidoreductase [Nitrososphaerales archaeon]|nr:TIGR03617 family F420-dependent LLM class oxidoreductase [Nitrososphaerales archaeon]
MKIDAEFALGDPSDVPALAKRAEDIGFDAFWVNETKHDPFIELALAAQSTRRISIGSSIALAFTRSPMELAYSAWDIQGLSNGRMILGLGTQVKGHIERRFGLKWESPRRKMREVVLALKSIWNTWQTGERLDFKGRFYNLDLMTPFFSPGRISNPRIPVYIAGVNRGMCTLAGEVGDGLHVHPLHTVRYLREEVLPSLERGLKSSGRERDDFEVAASVFAAPGRDRAESSRLREELRGQIAFYASTRTYRQVMDLHAWGETADRLHELSMAGRWEEMGREVNDEMLSEFVVDGRWEEIGSRIRERYSGIADRVRLYVPFDGNEGWGKVVTGFHD